MKRMVVISESMYKILTNNQSRNDVNNSITTSSDFQPNMDYQNIKRSNKEMEMMRRQELAKTEEVLEDEEEKQVLGRPPFNNSFMSEMEISHISQSPQQHPQQMQPPVTPKTPRTIPVSSENTPYRLKEAFFIQLKDLAPAKLEARLIGLAKRILNEPDCRLEEKKIHLGKNTFAILNFYDFLECSVNTQKKPNQIENLNLFVRYISRAKIPSSYVSNRYIRQMLLLENEKEQSDSESEINLSLESDVKPDVSGLETSTREKSFLEMVLPKMNWLSRPPESPRKRQNDDFD